MNENTHSQKKAKKKWSLCHVISIVSFCVGVLVTVLLGNQILISEIFLPAQEFIMRLNHLPSDVGGNYYYVTTPQNMKKVPVECNGNEPDAIGGVVEIQHKRTIINPKISFLNGERLFCLTNGAIMKLPSPKTWDSRWAFIDEGTLRARLEISDDRESFLEAKLPAGSEIKHFNATMRYISKKEGITGITNIKFVKCKEECDKNTLKTEMEYLLKASSKSVSSPKTR